ncbi:MAG: hypothetical protein HQL82_04770 [Magnetococcales bacterium]|nr:hypothetical protein [Magnetococcales bacterium]
MRALGAPPSAAYLWQALKSEIVDTIRREGRGPTTSRTVIRDPDIADHPEFLECLADLSGRHEISEADSRILVQRLGEHRESRGEWDEVARKRYSRARMKVASWVFLKWFAQREYTKVNEFRLPIAWMKEVAVLALRRGVDISCFQEAFDHPRLSPTIQNATWALRALAHRKPAVVGFFEEQIRRQHLYRGNVSYIFETLTALDPGGFTELYRRAFLPGLRDLPSRAIPDVRPFREQEPFQQRCIVDVVPYVPIVTGVPLAELESLKRQFLDGTDDVDFRRSLTWQMLRLRPRDGGAMETVINALSDEHDQINAYYIVKFIMGPGLGHFPEQLLNRNTCDKIRSVARRWPQNAYFAESAARVASRLKRPG